MAADKVAQNCFSPTDRAFRSLISIYRCQAKKRNLAFDLTYDQVKDLTSKPCAICGDPPHQIKRTQDRVGRYVYTGLDRIVNSKGYTFDNVQPACGRCNLAKIDMDFTDFKEWLARLKPRLDDLRKPISFDVAAMPLMESELNVSGRALLNRYMQVARRKQKVFELSSGTFHALTSMPCFYCGVVPSKTISYGKSTYVFNGIDRIDPAQGYVASNVVPCCWACNNAKSLSSVEDFVSWVAKCCQMLGI
jgi:hypothetical protein